MNTNRIIRLFRYSGGRKPTKQWGVSTFLWFWGTVGFLAISGIAQEPVKGEAEGPKGIAICIGLNSVDPQHYNGWTGHLGACENDARDMKKIAEDNGFTTKLLLTSEATRENLLDELRSAASTLRAGDILMIAYAGHGGQVVDTNSDEPKTEMLDETWCLFNGQFLDDELYFEWEQFKKGVRILVISGSCHSGSMLKVFNRRMRSEPNATTRQKSGTRALPAEAAMATYQKNIEFYKTIQENTPGESNNRISASVQLLSACRDDQFSSEIGSNGVFTSSLKKIWDEGTFIGNYDIFLKNIREDALAVNPDQEAQRTWVDGMRDQNFEAEKPFTIKP